MTKTPLGRRIFSRTPLQGMTGVFSVVLIFALLAISAVLAVQAPRATAAPSSQLNYQARFKMSNGALPADGYYNVTFRLYTVDSGGTPVWTEVRTDANRVRVANGYISVQLGSVAAFSTASPAIDWSQEMWLTTDIGGREVTPTWDGEMTPRLKLTAVPYAFKSEQAKSLRTTDNGFTGTLGWGEGTLTADRSILLPDEDVAGGNIICLQTSTACGFAPATGGTGYIQNGTVEQPAPANFNISGEGKASTLNATTSLQLNGTDINTAGTLTNVAYLNQVTTFKATANSAEAFRVQNAAGTASVLGVDTVNNEVAVGGDLRVQGNANYAGQVISDALQVDTLQGMSATLGSLSAGNASVQNAAVTDTLTVNGVLKLADSNTTPGMIQLGVRTTSGDPSGGTNGSMYYNSNLSKFRCYRNGGWEDCRSSAVASASFQQGGNALGETAVLGTTDNYGISVITNNVERINMTAAGDIFMTPTNSFAIQDDSGENVLGVDTVNNEVSLFAAPQNIGQWQPTSSVPVPYELNAPGAFVQNNRLYVRGGYSAPINPDGSLGTWSASGDSYIGAGWRGVGYGINSVDYWGRVIDSTGSLGGRVSADSSSLTQPFHQEGSYTVYRGVLYGVSGMQHTVVHLNGDGSLGNWSQSTIGDVPCDTYRGQVFGWGDYLYSTCGLAPYGNVVSYAPINSDGSLGTWTAVNAPVYGDESGAFAHEGYIYMFDRTSTDMARAPISEVDGSIGTWEVVDNALPYGAGKAAVAVHDGYVYMVGGEGAATGQEVYYAKLGGSATVDGSVSADELAVTAGIASLDDELTVAGTVGLQGDLLVQSGSGDEVLSVNSTTGVVTANPGAYSVSGSVTVSGDPSTLPDNNIASADWSSQGYLATGSHSSSYLRIYKQTGSSVALIATPAAVTTNARMVRWSTDGTYLAVGSPSASTSTNLYIYKRSGDTFTRLTNPSGLLGTAIRTVEWSPDGSYLAVGYEATGSGSIQIYKRSGDTFTLLSTSPSVKPTTWVASMAWSPDSSMLVVGLNGADNYVYKRSGDVFTRIETRDTTSYGSLEWSPDGRYLAAGSYSSASNRLQILERHGDSLRPIAVTTDLPGANILSVRWSPNGEFLAVGSEQGDGTKLTLYAFRAGKLRLLSDPGTLPGGADVYGAAFNADGSKLAVGTFSNSGTRFLIYNFGLSLTSSNALVVDESITSDALQLGNPVASSLAGAKFVTTTAEVQTTLRLGTPTDGVSFASGKLRLYGSSRNVRRITLSPEYPNAALSGAGTGSMLAGYDSSTNANYYRWTSGEATDQTRTLNMRYQLPDDWDSWGTNGFCIKARALQSTARGSLTLNNAAGVADETNANITPTSASAGPWDTSCFTLNGTYAAGDIITIQISLVSQLSGMVDASDITLTYLSSF